MASTSAPANLARLPPAWQPAADRLTCYYNSASQPSRACLQLLLEGKVDFKRVEIGLGGSQKKPEFKEVINPAGFVPVVYDEGEKRFIPESTDIMRHLSGRYPSLGSFYAGLPAEKKAQVDEILTFSAEKVRPITTGITRSIALSRDAKETAELKARIPGLVDQLEGRLREVKSGGAADPLYFAGTVGPSIADIQLLHEINGPTDLGLIKMDGSPLLARWLETMSARPAAKEAYGNFGWMMWGIKGLLKVKSCFGSKSGTL